MSLNLPVTKCAAAAACTLLLTALTLAGCGQTGALYFDEDPPADQLPPSRKTPPAAAVVAPLPTEPAVAPAAPEDAAAKK